MSNDNELVQDELFREMMGDVAPMTQVHAAAPRADRRPAGDFDARRRSASGENLRGSPTDPNFLTLGEVEQVAPWDELAWKKDGVQEGVYRKLRLGRYPLEGSLDLHRHTVVQARDAMFAFIVESQRRGLRAVLIQHGRGENSATPARIKSYVNAWLPELPQVIAFHTAQRHHGSYGAVYVLLRKGEEQKADNRERHGRKGIRAHTV